MIPARVQPNVEARAAFRARRVTPRVAWGKMGEPRAFRGDRRARKGTRVAWVAAGLLVGAVCITAALLIAVVDEFRGPPTTLRRMGALLAAVSAFAGLWLLLRPAASEPGCPVPLLVLSELDGSTPSSAAACPQTHLKAAVGLGATAFTLAVVLVTRRRRPQPPDPSDDQSSRTNRGAS